MKYLYECGCQRPDYITNRTNSRRCPDHDKLAIGKLRRCTMCGLWIQTSLMCNSKKYFCNNCKPIWAIQQAAKYRLKYKAEGRRYYIYKADRIDHRPIELKWRSKKKIEGENINMMPNEQDEHDLDLLCDIGKPRLKMPTIENYLGLVDLMNRGVLIMKEKTKPCGKNENGPAKNS